MKKNPYPKKKQSLYLNFYQAFDEIDLSFKQGILANGYFYLNDSKDVRVAKDLLFSTVQ